MTSWQKNVRRKKKIKIKKHKNKVILGDPEH